MCDQEWQVLERILMLVMKPSACLLPFTLGAPRVFFIHAKYLRIYKMSINRIKLSKILE